ncbi:MAG TPA: phosphoserine phosphatase SerB [Paracoccaceae bacterium]|nr:phosphoserine phosphatase SerB [Paracoccaceae bacterium]
MNHVVVLTASPLNGLSDLRIAEAMAMLEGAGAARRLSPDAAEIPVPHRQNPTLSGIDVNCIPAANRRKRLLIADMDSTIITVECIDEIAEAAGLRDQVQPITEKAMRGEIPFEEALRARVALLEGLEESQLQAVHDARIRLMPGARALTATMRAHGAYAALVSGGFTFFTERVAAEAGFDEHRANLLLAQSGRLTGRVAEPVLGRRAKLDALTEIAGRLGYPLADALAVGDGANDLEMIEAAGLGVAYHAKPVVAERADASIRHGDLTALLYLQGYSAAEIVTG